MAGRWICKECGGQFRGIMKSESLDEYSLKKNGDIEEHLATKEEFSDFEHYCCSRCEKEVETFSGLKKVAEWKE